MKGFIVTGHTVDGEYFRSKMLFVQDGTPKAKIAQNLIQKMPVIEDVWNHRYVVMANVSDFNINC